MLAVITLVFATYAATNIDNLLLLIGLVVSGVDRQKLLLGFMGGMLLILLISAGIGLVSMVMPVQYIGFLGGIPLLVGLHMIYGLIRQQHSKESQLSSVSIGSVITLQLSNGVDTILVFAPLFADSMAQVDYSISIAFLMAAIIWFLIATTVGQHARKIETLARYGAWLAPGVMIVLGLYILDNTVTDLVAGS